MADRLASGELFSLLDTLRRQEGRPWSFISRRLYADYGIEVADVTVKIWCEQLGIEAERAGAA